MASSRKRQRADLDTRLLDFLQQYLRPGQHLLLGLSGGLDSCVLLHQLAGLRQHADFHFSALHVNHGISPHAADWAHFCQRLCAGYEVPFSAISVNVPRDSGLGLEAAAREQRYRVLLETDADAVVLAHHQDDQAETLILQLLRGAGVKGLAAMGKVSHARAAVSGQEKNILRPLLDVSRAELEAYAKAQRLEWINDESNLDLAYDRNFLRHHVLPQLQERFPACRKTIARSAAHLAEAAALLEELAQEDAARAVHEGLLDLGILKNMSLARSTNLLRYWLAEQGGVPLSAARLDDIRSQLLDAKPDARIRISLGSRVLSRRRGKAVIA